MDASGYSPAELEYIDAGIDMEMIGHQKFAAASNIIYGENPPYTLSDFSAAFPNFPPAPPALFSSLLAMANDVIVESRFHEKWWLCMGLYLAHYLTQMNMADINAGLPNGLITRDKAGDTEQSYSHTAFVDPKWGDFNATAYGRMLVNEAKYLGLGGMYVG